LARSLKKNPKNIAEELLEFIREQNNDIIEEISALN
jgi:arginyl-tRNA synthetase